MAPEDTTQEKTTTATIEQPRVSVLVMTYNHGAYIAQALDSVMAQITDFAYEILISEDASTDGTRDIVIEYKNRFPKRIRLLLSEQNIASNAIVSRGIEAATGEYIALLDGDDYWTSTSKLQKQVGFLESNPGCAICFHNAVQVDENGQSFGNWTPTDQATITTIDDIWLGNYIATCSTMFRHGLIGEVPAWYESLFPITDWPLHILNAQHGDIGYINEVLGAYRIHHGGLYSPLSESGKLEATQNFYRRMNANLNYEHNRMIKTSQSKFFFDWAKEYLKRGDKRHARVNFVRSLRGRPINRYTSPTDLIKMAVRLYIPALRRGRR